ncbi:MAG: hypothetical protein HBSAPP03_13250 [Phycisphaerae bacterium]|nr:MAG: hypothetical protein HBSAPP03_13250 [Phycisphaerae bacterium]
MPENRGRVVPIAVLCGMYFVWGGCGGGIPKNALLLSPQSLENRQLQTRRFDSSDERRILAAAVGLAQDLGYNIENSDAKLGVVVGSKDRDATEAGQVVGAVLIAVLTGVATPVDKNQKIRISIVTHPVGGSTAVRVTFQRIVWNTQGQVSKLQFINDPAIYQEFFEKLSKSVFLEAHKI